MNYNLFKNTNIITSQELNIALECFSGENNNGLKTIKKFQTAIMNRDFYEADSIEAFNYLKKSFPKYFENNKINNVNDLYGFLENWIFKYKNN